MLLAVITNGGRAGRGRETSMATDAFANRAAARWAKTLMKTFAGGRAGKCVSALTLLLLKGHE